jgi:hypothetical protein
MLYLDTRLRKEETNILKSFEELSREQAERESRLSSYLKGTTGVENLGHFETELAERQGQILFEIATQLEDTQNAVKQADQLVQRLRKHLEQLKGLQRILTK